MRELPDSWRPLGVRSDPNAIAEWEGLNDGVPGHLGDSLWEWIRPLISGTTNRRTAFFDFDFWKWFERSHRVDTGIRASEHSASAAVREVEEMVLANDATMLALVDSVLARLAEDEEAVRLLQTLREGGSVWTVIRADVGFQLIRRIDETSEAIAQSVRGQGGKPAALLGRAWTQAFGREPNASDAYRSAVRGLEAAWCPVVLPDDGAATLGKVIAHLRVAGDKWEATLPGSERVDPIEVVHGMLALLWTSQIDRHVNDDTDLHVTQGAAEAAVIMASTLIHLIQSGAVRRRPITVS